MSIPEPSLTCGAACSIAISGLPSGAPAAVTVTGPGNYSHETAGSETLSGLTPGSYTVAAEPVTSDGESYTPALIEERRKQQ